MEPIQAVTSRLNKFPYITSSTFAAKAALAGAVFALLIMACTVTPEELPALDQRAQSLNKNLMCPICPGESIDQSQATIALYMREIVREKLDEGWTDKQIRDFFVDKYGPSVLMEPPTEGFGVVAWIVPPVIVGVAILAFLLAIKSMRGNSPGQPQVTKVETADPEESLEHYFERIETALEPHLAGAPPPADPKADDRETPNG